MNRCENCNHIIDPDLDLCDACQEEADEVEPNTCWKCEVELDDDSMYCENCNDEMENELERQERQYRRDVL